MSDWLACVRFPASHTPTAGEAAATWSDCQVSLRFPRRPLERPVRGLLLEMGGVLYDDTLWARWLLKLLVRLGLCTSFRCFFRLWQREYLAEVQAGRREFCDAFAAFLRDAGLSRGQIDEVANACHARRAELETDIRLLPDVRETLGQLRRRGLALALACNTTAPRDALRARLQRLGVESFFGGLASSLDVGSVMPEPPCYRAALAALGLSPGEVACVAHDTAVLSGAAAEGMATVAFNFDPDAQADVYLNRFSDLLEVIRIVQPLAAAG